ncbi:hypothetical protein [Corynebacterium sp. CCM 9204]|uniref:hypothetical protein n=1 Tax=Corynebacterium sp. CCM 9204 TaxID=3057616 RepID=UPI003523D6E5
MGGLPFTDDRYYQAFLVGLLRIEAGTRETDPLLADDLVGWIRKIRVNRLSSVNYTFVGDSPMVPDSRWYNVGSFWETTGGWENGPGYCCPRVSRRGETSTPSGTLT